MEIIHIINKGRLMDTLDNFHIYLETRKNKQINDKNTVKPNAIYDVIKVFPNVLLSSYVYLFISFVFVVPYVCLLYLMCVLMLLLYMPDCWLEVSIRKVL